MGAVQHATTTSAVTHALVEPLLRAAHNGHPQGRSAGAERLGRLVQDSAWSTRTMEARSSQWRAYLEFCTDEGRSALPAAEGSLLAYVGWLAGEHDAGRRAVSPSSLPQYLSAIRLMHNMVTGRPLAPMPYLSVATRAYAAWYAVPARTRRGADAAFMQLVYAEGMSESLSIRRLRDCALLIAAYVLGLRASSAVSLRAADVTVTRGRFRAKLCVCKGRPVRDLQPATYTRVNADLPSPIDVLLRWDQRRPEATEWFSFAGESLTSREVTTMIRNAALRLGGGDPDSLSSHSLRIGAHTEQVLLGVPLEVRKSRSGWAPNSPMEAVYFNRSIRLSPASGWFFGGL